MTHSDFRFDRITYVSIFLGYMLTVYIKDWIEKLNAVHQENDKIYFSNYLITILVIFSLQTQNLLPSVESLQSDSKAGAFRNGEYETYQC